MNNFETDGTICSNVSNQCTINVRVNLLSKSFLSNAGTLSLSCNYPTTGKTLTATASLTMNQIGTIANAITFNVAQPSTRTFTQGDTISPTDFGTVTVTNNTQTAINGCGLSGEFGLVTPSSFNYSGVTCSGAANPSSAPFSLAAGESCTYSYLPASTATAGTLSSNFFFNCSGAGTYTSASPNTLSYTVNPPPANVTLYNLNLSTSTNIIRYNSALWYVIGFTNNSGDYLNSCAFNCSGDTQICSNLRMDYTNFQNGQSVSAIGHLNYGGSMLAGSYSAQVSVTCSKGWNSYTVVTGPASTVTLHIAQ